MNLFLLATILGTILAIAVMLVYLIGRVNALTSLRAGESELEGSTDLRFAGVDSQQLWDLLVKPPDSAASAELQEALRAAYAPVLKRHLEELFEEGRLDARQGIQMPPRAPRFIKTTEGRVFSWLPVDAARALYEIGRRSNTPQGSEVLADLHRQADEIARQLFQECGLEIPEGFAASLMPEDMLTPASRQENQAGHPPPADMPAPLIPPPSPVPYQELSVPLAVTGSSTPRTDASGAAPI